MNYKLKYNSKISNIKDGIYLNFEDLACSIFSRKDYQNLKKIQPIAQDFDEWFNRISSKLKLILEESESDGYHDFGDFRIYLLKEDDENGEKEN